MTLFQVADESSGGCRALSYATRLAGGQSTEGPGSSRKIRIGVTSSCSYEYFHGDNGAGLGASHQTGWTGLIAFVIDFFGRVDAKTILETERVYPGS